MSDRAIRWVAGLAAASLTIALAACGGRAPEGDTGVTDAATDKTSLTLDEAKSLTIQRRDEIASYLPAGASSDVTATASSKSLLQCDGPDNYVWPGITIAKIDGEIDRDATIATIADAWSDRDGWSIERGTSEGGFPDVKLTNADGSYFAVGFHVAGSEFWVDSYSPCFHLDGGFVYGTEY